jgi:hypothetical protein
MAAFGILALPILTKRLDRKGVDGEWMMELNAFEYTSTLHEKAGECASQPLELRVSDILMGNMRCRLGITLVICWETE